MFQDIVEKFIFLGNRDSLIFSTYSDEVLFWSSFKQYLTV